MFCSKCGVKLPQKADKCPNCGAPAPAEEYCGGFWGLAKGNKTEIPEKTVKSDNNREKNESARPDNKFSEREIKALKRYKKNVKNLLITLAVLAVIAVVELIFIVVLAAGSGGAEQTEPTANIVTSETENQKIGGEIGEEIGGDKLDVEEIYGETTENPVQYGETEEIYNSYEETTENPYENTQEFDTEDVTENENGGIFQNDRKEDIASQF